MTTDPYARLDAVYLLGALDADERLGLRGAPGHLPTVPGGPWLRRAFSSGKISA